MACPISNSGLSSDYCENCASDFQLFGKKCELLLICDALDCPEDRICLVEDGLPRCSEFYCGREFQEQNDTRTLAIEITEPGDIACRTATGDGAEYSGDGAEYCTHSDLDTCQHALSDSSLTSLFACGQQHQDNFGCTGYDNCGSSSIHCTVWKNEKKRAKTQKKNFGF